MAIKFSTTGKPQDKKQKHSCCVNKFYHYFLTLLYITNINDKNLQRFFRLETT